MLCVCPIVGLEMYRSQFTARESRLLTGSSVSVICNERAALRYIHTAQTTAHYPGNRDELYREYRRMQRNGSTLHGNAGGQFDK